MLASLYLLVIYGFHAIPVAAFSFLEDFLLQGFRRFFLLSIDADTGLLRRSAFSVSRSLSVIISFDDDL